MSPLQRHFDSFITALEVDSMARAWQIQGKSTIGVSARAAAGFEVDVTCACDTLFLMAPHIDRKALEDTGSRWLCISEAGLSQVLGWIARPQLHAMDFFWIFIGSSAIACQHYQVMEIQG